MQPYTRVVGTADPTVCVCVASFNTRRATELCVRGIRRTAGASFDLIVGDGRSVDGSLEMLETFARSGALILERADGPRSHAHWLDHWYSTCRHRYLVFSDSDVDYRGRGWLADLLAVAEKTDAALVAGRIQPDWSRRPRFLGGAARVLPGERPEPCLMLIDVQQLRGVVETSFDYHEEPFPGDPTKKLGFDVGGAFLRAVRKADLHVEEMPPAFLRKYRHWGGLSWKHPSSTDITRKQRGRQLAKQALLWVRLLVERARDHDLPGRYVLRAPRP